MRLGKVKGSWLVGRERRKHPGSGRHMAVFTLCMDATIHTHVKEFICQKKHTHDTQTPTHYSITIISQTPASCEQVQPKKKKTNSNSHIDIVSVLFLQQGHGALNFKGFFFFWCVDLEVYQVTGNRAKW